MSKLATLQAKIPSGWTKDADGNETRDKNGNRERTKLCAGDLRKKLEEHAAGRLRFNEMSRLMEWDGRQVEEADARLLYVWLQEHGYKIGEAATVDGLLAEARRHKFHPVQEMLRKIRDDRTINPADLDSALGQIYGLTDLLHIKMIRKTLVAAVARAERPGCKVDTVLTLQSDRQGLYKSLSCEILAGKEFYASSTAAGKDQILLIQSTWILELAELDSITSRRDAGELKNVISTAEDKIRVPYGRSVEPMKRQGIIVATSNRADFLQDMTGSRRFWVVPITRPIDIEALRSQREQIWKAAIIAFDAGEQWWLDRDDEARVEEQNAHFETESPFMPLLRSWVATQTEPFTVTAAIVDSKCRNEGQVQKRDTMEAGQCLRKLGCARRRAARGNTRANLWHPPPYLPHLPAEVCPPEPVAAQPVGIPAIPAIPISEKSVEQSEETETTESTEKVCQVWQVCQSTAPQSISTDIPRGKVWQVCQPVQSNQSWIDSALVALRDAGTAATEQTVRSWLARNGAPEITGDRIRQALRANSLQLLE